ncbi:hypothetical protein WCLP8_3420002 [uncultured Gammaproteobacteria bacterium]
MDWVRTNKNRNKSDLFEFDYYSYDPSQPVQSPALVLWDGQTMNIQASGKLGPF